MYKKIVGIFIIMLFIISVFNAGFIKSKEIRSYETAINERFINSDFLLYKRGNYFNENNKINYDTDSYEGWRWVHNGASHDKDECFLSIEPLSAGTAGFACVLDLSADIGSVISKVAFCEYACSGTAGLNGRVIVYAGDYSAPSGPQLANTPFTVNQVRGYRDFDIPEVTIVYPGLYWIVIEIDQTDIEQCVVCLDEGPMVTGGGYLEVNHGGWYPTASQGFNDNPLIEAFVNGTECDKKPKLTDSSGKTKFYGVFVGGADPENKLQNAQINGVKAVHDALEQKKGWNEQNMRGLYGNGATKKNIKDAIELFKQKAIPGDEFVFYFCGHGGNNIVPDNDGDEPDNHDDHLLIANNDRITDDELTEWLSGFKKSVTINVILDACKTGFFNDGQKDLQTAKNANGEEYGDHMALNLGPKGPAGGCGYLWDDKNGDGIVQIDEITEWPTGLKRFRLVDEDGDGIPDYWWADLDGEGDIDENEKFRSEEGYTVLSEKTKKVLEGLNSKKHLSVYDDLTDADRDQDGKTTSKELFEFEVNGLYEELKEDNDQDGIFDEDDYDYVDNDGDSLIDEDPAFPNMIFWPNKSPDKPLKPSGTSSGKIGETYTYSTSTEDSEEDDIYYWFDWGDGTNSEWVGPSISGDTVSMSHSWSAQGDYTIKVKARDRCFAESEWSDPLEISMPKNKVINIPLFLQRLFQRFPFLNKILN